MGQDYFISQEPINLKSANGLSPSVIPNGPTQAITTLGVAVTYDGLTSVINSSATTAQAIYLAPVTNLALDKGQLKKISLASIGSLGSFVIKANQDGQPIVNTLMHGTTVLTSIALSVVGDSILLKYNGNGVWLVVDRGVSAGNIV